MTINETNFFFEGGGGIHCGYIFSNVRPQFTNCIVIGMTVELSGRTHGM